MAEANDGDSAAQDSPQDNSGLVRFNSQESSPKDAQLSEESPLNVKAKAFDKYDVPMYCRELLRRLSLLSGSTGSPAFKWDILDLLQESKHQLRDARQANATGKSGMWAQISESLGNEHTASTLPVGLRKQCEEVVARREMWLGDFDSELRAILARGQELRERLLFEDVDRAGWFSASGVSPIEVQRLLERHLDMHQRAARLARQLKLLTRALQQQGAVSSRRRAFAAKSMGEKLQSSLVCLAAVAVAPVPGSSEMWLATTTMMWLDKDQAWQHVVYEHPRDTDSETILHQFQCTSSKARQALVAWLEMPEEKRKGCALVHNASVRRVIVSSHIVNYIDGFGDSGSDWTSALDAHPLGSVMKKALAMGSGGAGDDKVVIGAQRLAVVPLPPKPDTNWGWRGLFAYGDTKVGECPLREGGIYSFICVDCGLRVGDREENAVPQMDVKKAISTSSFLGDLSEEEDVGHEGSEILDGEPRTHVEVVNGTEEPVQVKILAHAAGGHATRLFKSALAEGTISPDSNRVFKLKADRDTPETNFDVEVRIGNKKAKCEVVGEQVVFVDGTLADL